MGSLREHVQWLHMLDYVVVLGKFLQISGKCGRVAGDVDESLTRLCQQVVNDTGIQT